MRGRKVERFYKIKVKGPYGEMGITGVWTKYKWYGKLVGRYYVKRFFPRGTKIVEQGFLDIVR